jgi:uncharacterized protein YggE
MRKNLLLSLLSLGLFGLSGIAWGAQAVMSGQGRVLASPDYVELGIQVESKCFSTPAEARKANDEAAKKIVDFLNTKIKKDNHYNKVVSLGGYTNAYQQYYQDKILCPNTFQKINNITFRTQEISNFEQLFDEIQSQVYQLFTTEPRGMIESSVTYVTLSSPMANISDEKRAQFEQEAMAMALGDAKAKLMSLFGKDKIQNLKIIQVSELPPERPMPMGSRDNNAPMAMMSARAEKSVPAPIQFDTEWITKTVYFTFSFDDLTVAKRLNDFKINKG